MTLLRHRPLGLPAADWALWTGPLCLCVLNHNPCCVFPSSCCMSCCSPYKQLFLTFSEYIYVKAGFSHKTWMSLVLMKGKLFRFRPRWLPAWSCAQSVLRCSNATCDSPWTFINGRTFPYLPLWWHCVGSVYTSTVSSVMSAFVNGAAQCVVLCGSFQRVRKSCTHTEMLSLITMCDFVTRQVELAEPVQPALLKHNLTATVQ